MAQSNVSQSASKQPCRPQWIADHNAMNSVREMLYDIEHRSST